MKAIRMTVLFLCVAFLLPTPVQSQSVDFIQLYERGKLLLRQRLYTDALKEFKKSTYTDKGKTHFGAHFYMAICYLRLSAVAQASKALDKAIKLAKSKRHNAAAARLKKQIDSLYGAFRIMPEVDPDEVGRLRIKLEPKVAFSNKQKRIFHRRLAKRLLKKGLVPNNNMIYLPKGEYTIQIAMPQCLKYALISGNTKAKELNIDDSPSKLSLRGTPSCECIGGQRLYRIGKKLTCSCPSGLGWNKAKQRCEKTIDPVPIIVGVSVAAVVLGGGAAILVAVLVGDQKIGAADTQLDKNSVWGKPQTTPAP